MKSKLAIFALCWAILAAPASRTLAANPNKVNGPYDVIVAGSLVGTGQVTVGGPNVNMNIDVRDPLTGATGKLKAHLKMDNGRFDGTGTALGVECTVSGRVEAPDGTTVKTARILCNFGLVDGRNGRIVGEKKGG